MAFRALLAFSLLATLVSATTITVEGDSSECFREKVEKESILFGNFEVLSGGDLNLDVSVNDVSSGTQVYGKRSVQSDRFGQKVSPGKYEICFSTKGLDSESRSVSFNYYAGEGFSHQDIARKGTPPPLTSCRQPGSPPGGRDPAIEGADPAEGGAGLLPQSGEGALPVHRGNLQEDLLGLLRGDLRDSRRQRLPDLRAHSIPGGEVFHLKTEFLFLLFPLAFSRITTPNGLRKAAFQMHARASGICNAIDSATIPLMFLFQIILIEFSLPNMSTVVEQRNQEATVYIGNLDTNANEELLWELMLQAGPIVSVNMPRDKVSGLHQGYGFVEFKTEEDADYALKVMNMIKLFGKPIRCNKATTDKKIMDIGANLFVGNLAPEVDEKMLFDTFSNFGGLISTPKSGGSKGFAFLSYDSFDGADRAIESMNGQFFGNRPVVVQYAYKKDAQGERHGSEAERTRAQSIPARLKPNTIAPNQEGGGLSGPPMGGSAPPSVPPPVPFAYPGMRMGGGMPMGGMRPQAPMMMHGMYGGYPQQR